MVVSTPSVFVACVIVYHLLGSADDRNEASPLDQHALDLREKPRVGDMRAIPRQEVVYPMMGCRRDVQRIDLSLGRKNGTGHDLRGDRGRIWRAAATT